VDRERPPERRARCPATTTPRSDKEHAMSDTDASATTLDLDPNAIDSDFDGEAESDNPEEG